MFNNILLAVDLSDEAAHEKALQAAQKHLDAGSHLYVVSVIPAFEGGGFAQSFLPPDYDKNLIEKAQVALRAFTEKYLSDVDNVSHLVAHGKIYEKITEIAAELDIDLIIALASGENRHAFGPNVARIVRNSHCSVMVLR